MLGSFIHTVPIKNLRLSYARIALYTGGISAIIASICCIGQFLLVTLGFRSTWILFIITFADWIRPFFILLALITLGVSYQIIWGFTPPVPTTAEERMTRKEFVAYKTYFWFVVFLVVAILMLPYFSQNMGLIIE